MRYEQEDSEHRWGNRRIVCDTCGRDCASAFGSPNPLVGEFRYDGVYGDDQYDFELWHADLCRDCARFVRDVIDTLARHNRPEPAGGVTVVEDMHATRAEYEMREGSVPATKEEAAATAERFRTWFFHAHGIDL